MRYKFYYNVAFLSVLCIVNFYSTIQAVDQNSESNTQSSYVGRVWGYFFGSSKPSHQGHECPTCKGQSGSASYIENAQVVSSSNASSGQGAGAPVTINNLSGNLGGSNNSSNLSEATILALKKEETRQIELANDRALQEEHERNKWFNTLVQYIDTRATEISEQERAELKENAKELLNYHHEALSKLFNDHGSLLKDIEASRSANELEKERLRQESLPVLLEHDLEKSKLLHEQFIDKLRVVGNGIYQFAGDKERLTKTALTVSGLILAGYASKRSTKVVSDYAAALLMKPNLATETSRAGLKNMIMYPFKKKGTQGKLPQVIYNADLQKYVNNYIDSINTCKIDDQPLRNALFYGAPGVGKTLLARTIAHKLGMDYAIIPAANISQFDDPVKELNKLFDWAEHSKKGTILFFDEIDALVPKRLTHATSEKTRQTQNTLYARTGTETNKFLVLGATNTPDLLDAAFLSRMDERIKFTLPDLETRKALLRLYFDIYILQSKSPLNYENGVLELFESVAEKIEGFSGREISQLIRAFRSEACSSRDKIITKDIVNNVVNYRVREHHSLSY